MARKDVVNQVMDTPCTAVDGGGRGFFLLPRNDKMVGQDRQVRSLFYQAIGLKNQLGTFTDHNGVRIKPQVCAGLNRSRQPPY